MHPKVLFVSKAISEPFHDGSQCFVRDVVLNLQNTDARVMGKSGKIPEVFQKVAHIDYRPVYAGRSSFAPGLVQNAQAALHLATERYANIWHFVFAPNGRSSSLARKLCALRSRPSIQTIASAPRHYDGLDEILFGDKIIAQSEHTLRLLQENSSSSPERFLFLPQPLTAARKPTDEEVRRTRENLGLKESSQILVYPGDLEMSQGAAVSLRLIRQLEKSHPESVLVLACRTKTPLAVEVQQELMKSVDPERVKFAGELPSLLPLLELADVVLFPADDLWGKVDRPVAMLEALSLGKAVLCWDHGPLAEILGAIRVPFEDELELRKQAAALLDSESLRAAKGEEGRQWVERAHSASRISRRFESVYAELHKA